MYVIYFAEQALDVAAAVVEASQVERRHLALDEFGSRDTLVRELGERRQVQVLDGIVCWMEKWETKKLYML